MEDEDLGENEESLMKRDMSTQTDMDLVKIEELVIFRNKVLSSEKKQEEVNFSLSNIKDYESKVTFYTGFAVFFNNESIFTTFLAPLLII